MLEFLRRYNQKVCKNFKAVVPFYKIKGKILTKGGGTTMRKDNMKKGCKSTPEYEY